MNKLHGANMKKGLKKYSLYKDPVIVVQFALVCWKVGGNVGVISITLAQPM